MDKLIVCSPRSLKRDQWVAAAQKAIETNPANKASVEALTLLNPAFKPTPEALAVMTTKYWGPQGVHLTVGFLDNPPADLRQRILSHMNAWCQTANVEFVETNTDPQVRIARMGGMDGGYWSYVGTDILTIPADQPTMNLEDFTMDMPESEFIRVIRHETGHTMGFPHEHMRRELVNKIDPVKAFVFFRKTQGWNKAMVRAQVLTPIEEAQLMGTPQADPHSIMCYQLPGEITIDGQPIIGGVDIDASDFAFAGMLYPRPTTGA